METGELEMPLIGICDTTFARYDMTQDVIRVFENYAPRIKYVRYTVPGIKDLPVAALKLFTEQNCDLVIALGMPGPKAYDKISAQVASQGIVQCQLQTGKHILEVFIHEDEGKGEDQLLKQVMQNRAEKHALNAVNLLLYPEKLQENAGKGIRQGFANVGSV